MKYLALSVVLFFNSWAFAAYEDIRKTYIPRRMNVGDRKIALQVLGFGAASKVLGSPYPFGGHSGFEVGVSSEYIPAQDLKSLGVIPPVPRGELNYFSLSIGKGLFYNVDTVLHFTPAFQKEDLTTYGGQIRWMFYEFPFMKGGLSGVLHGSGANYDSLINTRTTGMDLIATVVVEDVSLYFGIGEARALGTFQGGGMNTTTGESESTTNSCSAGYCDTAYEDIRESHTIMGLCLFYSEFFAAFQIDRYYLSTYSARLGFRF